MLKRRFALLVCAACIGVSGITAQEAPEESDRGEGFKATIDTSADIFSLTNRTFDRPDIRVADAQNYTIVSWLLSNRNFSDAARASIEYNGAYFGGRFGFQPQFNDQGMTTFGALVNAWVRLGFLRVSLGNDVGTGTADSLGADPGLRVYNGDSWNSYTNPDNITEGNGLLAEASFGQLRFAFAAGDFIKGVKFTNRIEGSNNENEYQARFNVSYRYGASAAYDLGDFGVLSTSYIIKEKTIAEAYEIKGQNSADLVPFQADAQVFDHAFGIYASRLRLSDDISLTLGYNALITSYLREFWNPIGGGAMVETGFPLVFHHAANVMARWNVSDRISLRTDHNLTFWQDKDYDIFETGQANWNLNLGPKSRADSMAMISHIVLWNGIGMSYAITEKMSWSIYARNLLSSYSASGFTPAANTGKQEYSFVRNQMQLNLGLGYSFNQLASVSVSVVIENMITSRSRDLNSLSNNYFVSTVGGQPVVPVGTVDNEFVVRVPIGITLHLR